MRTLASLRSHWVWCLFSGVLLLPLAAQAADLATGQGQAEAVVQPLSVEELLNKMATTSHQLNYSGSFTYQRKDYPALQGFKVFHWVENGIEHERLQYLNGPEREISRSGKAWDCESLGDELLQGKFLGLGDNGAKLGDFYRFEVLGSERVAGRNTTMLTAIPRDLFRFSYILSIDNETGLVLKSWLVDEAGRPMERYQFVDLQMNPDLAEIKQQPQPRLHRASDVDISECNRVAAKQPEKWQLLWVPPGFAFVGQKVVREDIDMLMYTDGLTSFSVFIEPAHSAIPEGVAQRGATLAVMDSLKFKDTFYRVTVVGEIPVVTAQKIAQNIGGL